MKNERIKILFIHANNYDIGGSDYCLLKMVKELDNTKYEPIVLLRIKTDIVKLYKKNGIAVVVKPILRFQKTKNILKLFLLLPHFLFSLIYISYLIKKMKISIVHSNDLLDFTGGIAATFTGVKAVQHIRMILPDGGIKKILVYIVTKFNDKILAVSNGVKKNMFPKNNNALVFYDWIDMESVEHSTKISNIKEELNIDNNIKLIGCVGRLEEWKGQHLFIEAANMVIKKRLDVVFLIVGGPVLGKENYELSLRERVRKLSLKEKVLFLGERRDIASIFKQLYFSVHCSILPDPFPGVVLESLVNGTPVIGANAGGVPEEIDNMNTGLLYEMGSATNLANKIILLLDNSELRSTMAHISREIILKKFDKQKLIIQLEKIYDELLG